MGLFIKIDQFFYKNELNFIPRSNPKGTIYFDHNDWDHKDGDQFKRMINTAIYFQ